MVKNRLIIFLLFISILYKLVLLDRVPGINGDEVFGFVMMRDFSNGLASWPWWTPTGRILTPMYTSLVMLVNTLFPNGFGYMRLVPAMSHFALLVAAYFSLRKRLTTQNLLLFILLLSALPLHTVFARVSWEPCLIPLMIFLTIQLAIEKKFIFSAIMLFVSILTHSVCVFISPLVYFLWFADLYEKNNHQQLKSNQAALLIAFITATLIISKLISSGAGVISENGFTHQIFLHFIDINGLLNFFGLLFYTILGSISFNEFTGKHYEISLLPSIKILGICTILFLATCYCVFYKKKKSDSLLFLIGLTLSLYSSYLVAGDDPLAVGYQRYVLWFGVPMVFLIYDFFSLFTFHHKALLSLSLFFLIYTAYGYFLPSLTREIDSFPPMYASGNPEPKRAALEWIQETTHKENISFPQNKTKKISLLAESWWLYWPSRYWFYGQPFEFYYAENPPSTGLPVSRGIDKPQDIESILLKHGFVIGFSKGPIQETMTQTGLSQKFYSHVFLDAAKNPLIVVWHGVRN